MCCGKTERVAVRKLGLQLAFRITVLQALHEVILAIQGHELYFDRIRNARDEPINEDP